MAKKPTVTTISSGYASNTQLNANFTALRDGFDNTLSLDGSTPNAMGADLDMNGYAVTNGTASLTSLTLNGQSVGNLATAFNWRGAWVTATSYLVNDVVSDNGNSYIALQNHTSGATFSVDLAGGKWELLAQKGAAGAGTGDLLAANNLSDLASAPTALGNLGITATAAELNALDGITATVNELNILDGATVTFTEVNYLSGLTSSAVGETDTQTLTNKTLTAPTLTNAVLSEGVVEDTYAASITGSVALDTSNGTLWDLTLTGNVTFTDSVSAGESILLMINDGTAYTITWPTITWVNNGGAAPTLATTGDTVVSVWKIGTTLYGALVGDGS